VCGFEVASGSFPAAAASGLLKSLLLNTLDCVFSESLLPSELSPRIVRGTVYTSSSVFVDPFQHSI